MHEGMQLVFPYVGWSIQFFKWGMGNHLHHPQPNLRDHLVEGNHINENVDMVA